MNLGVGNDATDPGLTLSYGDGGAPLPKIIDPRAALPRCCSSGLAVELGSGGHAPPRAPAASSGKAWSTTLRWRREDACARGSRRAEQQKLDQHLSALSDLEKQLGGAMAGGPVCAVPSMPDASQFPKLKQYNGGEQYFDAITNAHIDMLAQAMACDVTRFGTLFMADLSLRGREPARAARR